MERKKVLVLLPMTQVQKDKLEQILPDAEYSYTSISEVTKEQNKRMNESCPLFKRKNYANM